MKAVNSVKNKDEAPNHSDAASPLLRKHLQVLNLLLYTSLSMQLVKFLQQSENSPVSSFVQFFIRFQFLARSKPASIHVHLQGGGYMYGNLKALSLIQTCPEIASWRWPFKVWHCHAVDKTPFVSMFFLFGLNRTFQFVEGLMVSCLVNSLYLNHIFNKNYDVVFFDRNCGFEFFGRS